MSETKSIAKATRLRKAVLLAAAMLVFGAAIIASPARAATLSFSPVSQSVISGGSVDVEVVISGLGDGAAPSLGAYDFDVLFDPGLLSVSSVSFGDPLNGDQLDLEGNGTYTESLNGVGDVNLVQLSFDSVATLNSSQLDTFVVAVITFDAFSVGVSGLSFDNVVLSDAAGAGLSAATLVANIEVIPLPLPLLLMLSGLMCLPAFRRRQ